MARPEDFPVGAVVRHTAKGRQTFPRDKHRRGVVVGVLRSTAVPEWWLVRVKVSHGRARPRVGNYAPDFWEPVPHGALDADEAAVALANAVLAGDREAARALADRVMELCQIGRAHV